MAPCKRRTKGATLPHSLCNKKNAIKKCSQVLWFSYFTTLLWMFFICNACFCFPYNPQIAQLQDLGAHESCQIRPSLYFLWHMLPPQMGSSSRTEITNDSVTTWKPHRGREERDAIHFGSTNKVRACFLQACVGRATTEQLHSGWERGFCHFGSADRQK